jgi:hypothetical protein
LYKNGSFIFSISMRPLNTVLRIKRTLDGAEINIVSDVDAVKALAMSIVVAPIGASASCPRAAFAQNVIIGLDQTGCGSRQRQ